MNSRHHDVKCIAQWFIDRARENRDYGDILTLPKLQKLIYYAEAWSLVVNNTQLFDDHIHAWPHGPAVPALYERLNGNNWLDLDQVDLCGCDPHEGVFDQPALDIFERVWQTYGDETGRYLESLTQSEEPWKVARGNAAPEAPAQSHIDRGLMLKFYRQIQDDAQTHHEPIAIAA